jgi:Cys-tRNA(Pro)/Cys-tRNA(Cys) deacylase
MGTSRGAATNAATPAMTALSRSGVAFTVHRYQHDPAAVPAERVFKTLLADVDGNLIVAVVPVVGSLDLKALAAASGGKRASMAASAAAERATGYLVGGISPFGQRRQLPTIVDKSATDFDTVYVSAGRRGLDLELAPADLIRLTGATTARIGRHG